MVTVQRCINVLLTYLFTLVVLLQSRNRSRTIVGVKIAAAWVVSFIIAYPRPARTSSKRPTLSRVGRGTLTQSINHSRVRNDFLVSSGVKPRQSINQSIIACPLIILTVYRPTDVLNDDLQCAIFNSYCLVFRVSIVNDNKLHNRVYLLIFALSSLIMAFFRLFSNVPNVTNILLCPHHRLLFLLFPSRVLLFPILFLCLFFYFLYSLASFSCKFFNPVCPSPSSVSL